MGRFFLISLKDLFCIFHPNSLSNLRKNTIFAVMNENLVKIEKGDNVKRSLKGVWVRAFACMCVWFLWGMSAEAAGVPREAYPGGRCHLFRLQLKDKAGTPFNLKHPEAYLSAKALERRARQNLKVDSTDLPLSPVYLERIRETGLRIVSQSKWNNTVLVATSMKDDEHRLRALPFVERVTHVFSSPDSIIPSKRDVLFPDEQKPDTAAKSAYGKASTQIEMLNGARLHEAGFRGKGITIVVTDGGFMNADVIPLLRKVNVVATRDFVYPASDDFFGELDHGTEVLSTMAMNEPNLFVGTAPEAQYILARTEDGRTESGAEEDFWVAAAEYADSIGADVINASLGYHNFDGDLGNYKYADLDGRTSHSSRAAAMLAGKGIVFVTSAGNDGMGAWKKIGVPGDADGVLAVGAVTEKRVNTPFSSVGPSADGRVKPDVMAMGAHSTVVNGRGKVVNANGTSFSSPITCGMVACLWQALPHKTAAEIMDLVRASADRFEKPDNIYGYGIPDFWKAYKLGGGTE